MPKTIYALMLTSLVLVAPSSADTFDALVENGVVVNQNGATHETRFEQERYTSSDGVAGTFTHEAGTLCLTPDGGEQSRCFELPSGKVSGDTFPISLPDGSEVIITIK